MPDATPETPSADAGAQEIRQLAKAHQYARYLSALLAPRAHREALIVLAAFAGELNRIPFLVSEPMMAAVRLQWWRDELSSQSTELARAGESEARRTGHMLCDALLQVLVQYRLPIGLLQGMIDAAETELDPTPFNDTGEVHQVSTKFDAALFELSGRIQGVTDTPREIWANAGRAFGAASWAVEAGWRRKAGAQLYISREQFADQAADLHAAEARSAMEKLRSRYGNLDRAARTALLPLATVPLCLRAVATASQQSDDITPRPGEFACARAIAWAHWLGRI
jgi:phytoene synthase